MRKYNKTPWRWSAPQSECWVLSATFVFIDKSKTKWGGIMKCIITKYAVFWLLQWRQSCNFYMCPILHYCLYQKPCSTFFSISILQFGENNVEICFCQERPDLCFCPSASHWWSGRRTILMRCLYNVRPTCVQRNGSTVRNQGILTGIRVFFLLVLPFPS